MSDPRQGGGLFKIIDDIVRDCKRHCEGFLCFYAR